MTPLCVACHLSLGVVLSLFILFLMFYSTQCTSLVLTYDCISLLNLQVISNRPFNHAQNSSHYVPPPLLMSIPDCLRCWSFSLPARKCRRQRGKRGGLAVKLKLLLAHWEFQSPLGLNAEGSDRNHPVFTMEECTRDISACHGQCSQWSPAITPYG